jgi:glycosyltransferase involved in cell wall biosynthesis
MSSETAIPEATAARPASAATSTARAASDRRVVVVYVIDNMRLGGTELNAVRTAERLDRERFELHVVCLGEDGPLTERYRAIGVPVVNMPIRSFYGWSMLRSGWRFVRYLRRVRADVVHAHDVYSNIFVAVWARFGGASVVIASRRWWHSLPNPKLRIGNRLAFRRASVVLANSAQVASSVREEAGVPESRVWTITNFADESAFTPLSERERRSRRAEWGAADDAVVIGCVARFDPVKDHLGLIRAFALVREQHPQVHLVLVGDGGMRHQIESLVSDLGLQRAVHLTGELRDRGNLHRGFDISVLASRSEGFPNTLVEAMAAGNSVVATAVGGSIDAVIDGETGLLVSSGEASELANALERLVASAELRDRFGREGRCRALERYSASEVVGSLEQMYGHLVAGLVR